ncbi:oxidoreductase of aldo/keto reductase family, subgroup 1 [Lachnospiraceae bacterium TWA4]|nr:oxidoreductase of aldo/keto reductase family, subgroup 1 [Lachnospiraceae bacterium TWA4]
MLYFTLNNGIQMPVIGFGTWDVRGAEGEKILLDALDVGYRLVDTAKMYDNEKIVGNAICRCGINRNELFITTKLHTPYASYKKAKAGIEESLNNLQSDWIDLMLVHEPYEQGIEMYEAMTEAYREGKIRAIGVSNLNEKRFEDFIRKCEVIPMVNQVESHVYYPELELKKKLEFHGTIMQGWAPFTEGRRNIFAEPILMKIGESHGKTSGQVALRYLLQNGIGVIPKSSKKERMRENMEVFDFSLTDEEMKQIKKLNEGKSLFGWY